jgi:DNA-directed RNA polymerase II subunit RPB2
MSEIFDDETWHAVNAYIKEHGLLRHQIGAYNNFVEASIPKIIEMFKKREFSYTKEENGVPVTSRYIVEITDSIITSPRRNNQPLIPNTCLHINASYSAQLYINVKITPPAGAPKIHQNHHIGDIPVMMMSNLCNLYEHRNDHMKLYQLGEDPMDAGGCFIVGSKSKDGSAHKKFILAQEKSAPNMIFNFLNKKPTNKKFEKYSEARCTSHNGTTTTTCTVGFFKNQHNLFVYLPYFETEIPIGVLFVAYGIKLEEIVNYVYPPGFDVHDDELSILEYSLEFSYEHQNQEACLKYIGMRKKQKVVEAADEDAEEVDAPILDEEEEEEMALLQDEAEVSYARKLLSDYLFIHTGISQSSQEVVEGKLLFLGKMARNAIKLYLGKIKPTDRDHMNNKRVMDVDVLLSQQLLSAFKRLYVDVEKKAMNALKTGTGVDILSSLKSSIITNSLGGALSNNSWARGTANGVSQILETFNACGSISNLRKLTVPEVAANTKSVDPRDLHGSHYQVICPVESPEGDKVGLMKNLAMLAQITFSYDIYTLYKLVKNFPEKFNIYFSSPDSGAAPEVLKSRSLVTINNSIIGYVNNPAEFTSYFRNKRRSGEISREISIYNNVAEKTVEILCDGGRMCYPALVVNNGVLALDYETVQKLASKTETQMTWTELCSNGFVDILDKNEENECYIANYPSDLIRAQASNVSDTSENQKHTHCILHPSAMYGIGGSIVPFPDHNQSPRNCYQASMGKQAIGIPQLNYKNIAYGKFHSLEYLQKPLALSRFGSLVGFNELPAGQNAVVCIKCNSFNEEDSIEMSKAAIERGFMTSYFHNTYHTEARDNEVFRLPTTAPNTIGTHAYRHLDEKGIVKVGSKVEKNDVLLCKVVTGLDKKEVVHTITYSHMYPAVIDKVVRGETEKGYECVRVMTIQRREPKVGDKFAARHGQKGTIGMIWNQEDLPQDRYGVSPDIIINSLALPSRMTIAMMIEAITGVAVCSDSLFNSLTSEDLGKVLRGEKIDLNDRVDRDAEFKKMFMSSPSIIDATPFRYFDLGVIRRELKRCGIQDLCDEQMIDGITGKPYTALIFRGLIYYQRLKHMACDKIHARARGAKTTLTRQPKEGRGQNGGLRIGWQERDAGNASGCTNFVKDRMLDNSDSYTTYVCKACGLIAIYNPKTKNKECKTCCSKQISKIVIPYGTHLVFMEFGGMNAFPRLITE